MSVNSPDGTRAAEMEQEWESPYSSPEMELEAHETHFSNPEEEWETHEAHYSNPYSMPEAVHYSTPEMEEEWETHESHYSNPYSTPEMESESHYSNPEDEWENHYSTPEATHYSTPEMEWETHESHYSNPYSMPEAVGYSTPEMEEEWEDEAHYSNPEDELEREHARPRAAHAPRPGPAPARHAPTAPRAAPHAPRAAPHVPRAVRAAPHVTRVGAVSGPIRTVNRVPVHAVRRLVPAAQRAAPGVARHVLGGPAPGTRVTSATGVPSAAFGRRPMYGRHPMYGRRRFSGRWPGYRRGPGYRPAAGTASTPTYGPRPAAGVAATPGVSPVSAGGPRYGPRPAGRQFRRQTVASLFRQLSRIFGEGEAETAEVEAELFGANEFEGEIAGHETAHEAALTEVLAAEAAHTENEGESEALLGAALPITITIMGGRRPLRRVQPTLAQANSRLVRGIRRSGPTGPQLLRAVPAIQRRTIASLKAAQRAGRPITPNLVVRVMAGQAARVLGTPRIFGPAVTRNTAIRQSTVAPAGRRVRPVRS